MVIDFRPPPKRSVIGAAMDFCRRKHDTAFCCALVMATGALELLALPKVNLVESVVRPIEFITVAGVGREGVRAVGWIATRKPTNMYYGAVSFVGMVGLGGVAIAEDVADRIITGMYPSVGEVVSSMEMAAVSIAGVALLMTNFQLTRQKVLGSGPIEIFTNQMIGDSILLGTTGGMHERTILVERQAMGEA